MSNYTGTTEWSDQVQAFFDADYLLAVTTKSIFDQPAFVRVSKAMDGQRGSSWKFPIVEALAPAVTEIDEYSDVTPVTSTDNTVTVTLREYANAVRTTAKLRATAYTNVHKIAAEQISKNFTASLELLARYAFTQGTRVFRPAARTSLTRSTSTHLITNGNLANVVNQARGLLMPEMPDSNYAAIIHSFLSSGLLQESNWLTLAEYAGGNKGINILTGEVGQLQGVRFTTTPYGKIYYGGGTVAQAATTISAAVAAGDTTFTVASATGLAA